ncbi:hypothetical protein SAMN05421642_1308 [Rhodococcoides kyotonense]|uniref:Lipoprotein n=1 Tax=Rhodococcoides kyotonense TaxID=398843 RepID=A0A239N6U9_9NOCA|nr:hypothetical protein SAMN05421642_1308 [Rhodococcus kyotonensis]
MGGRRRIIATVAALTATMPGIASCSLTGDVAVDSTSCSTPATAPYTHYVDTETRPPWATNWAPPIQGASGGVEATDGEGSDDTLFRLTFECAGLTDLHWIDHTDTDRRHQQAEVVVGVQRYLYRTANVPSDGSGFVIAVAIQRASDTSARFGVLALHVHGEFSPVPPDGADVVQSLRSHGLL